MLDVLMKTLYTGLGLASMTKDRIEEFGKDLVRQSKLSEQEGRELVDGLLKRSEEARADLETRIQSGVAQAMARMNLAPRDQVDALAERVRVLEEALAARSNPPQP